MYILPDKAHTTSIQGLALKEFEIIPLERRHASSYPNGHYDNESRDHYRESQGPEYLQDSRHSNNYRYGNRIVGQYAPLFALY